MVHETDKSRPPQLTPLKAGENLGRVYIPANPTLGQGQLHPNRRPTAIHTIETLLSQLKIVDPLSISPLPPPNTSPDAGGAPLPGF